MPLYVGATVTGRPSAAGRSKRRGSEVVTTRIRRHVGRLVVGGFAVLAFAGAALDHPAHGGAAGAAGSPSSNVAIVPGFEPAAYPGFSGAPPLPVHLFPAYHFSELAPSAVT